MNKKLGFNSSISLFLMNYAEPYVLTSYYRELMAEGGDSLSSTLAGLRETGYYDYNIPKHTEI